ncbi:MAG: hypothetical protein L6V93_15945 [Clostridiales bacterium]|nr:MAG: hypothetical protein L6V93_15945 [Clostridiales bacterium]
MEEIATTKLGMKTPRQTPDGLCGRYAEKNYAEVKNSAADKNSGRNVQRYQAKRLSMFLEYLQ